MKVHSGVEVQLHALLTSAPDRGEWSAPRPGRITPKGKSPLHPLGRRPDVPQSRSARRGANKNFHPPSELEPPDHSDPGPAL
jgi:hypothetical protein